MAVLAPSVVAVINFSKSCSDIAAKASSFSAIASSLLIFPSNLSFCSFSLSICCCSLTFSVSVVALERASSFWAILFAMDTTFLFFLSRDDFLMPVSTCTKFSLRPFAVPIFVINLSIPAILSIFACRFAIFFWHFVRLFVNFLIFSCFCLIFSWQRSIFPFCLSSIPWKNICRGLGKEWVANNCSQ